MYIEVLFIMVFHYFDVPTTPLTSLDSYEASQTHTVRIRSCTN